MIGYLAGSNFLLFNFFKTPFVNGILKTTKKNISNLIGMDSKHSVQIINVRC